MVFGGWRRREKEGDGKRERLMVSCCCYGRRALWGMSICEEWGGMQAGSKNYIFRPPQPCEISIFVFALDLFKPSHIEPVVYRPIYMELF